MHKRSFGTRVWNIADKFNIEQTQVHKIISSYISYCRNLLLTGNEVTFFNLVTMTPNVIVSDYRTTLAYQCKQVSKLCGVSYHTVYIIVKDYLEYIREDILSGNSVDIRGIVTLHPLRDDSGTLTRVHSSISISIKRDLENLNGCVTSVRAHTHKLLKYSIKLSGDTCQGVYA